MTRCQVCGEEGVAVSPQTQPEMGPLELADATIHTHAGVAFYHD